MPRERWNSRYVFNHVLLALQFLITCPYVSQVTFGIERLLLSNPNIASVHQVFDHVAMQNGAIQEAEVTPDHYAHGELIDGRTFEAIGDSKQHVSKSLPIIMHFKMY